MNVRIFTPRQLSLICNFSICRCIKDELREYKEAGQTLKRETHRVSSQLLSYSHSHQLICFKGCFKSFYTRFISSVGERQSHVSYEAPIDAVNN